MMNRFSIKLFLGFWTITVLLLLAQALFGNYVDSNPKIFDKKLHERREHIPELLRNLEQISRLEPSQQNLLLTSAERDLDLTIYLITPTGFDTREQGLSPEIASFAERLRTDTKHRRQRFPDYILFGRITPDGYVMVFSTPLPPPPWLLELKDTIGLRLLVAILMSGLLSMLMAKAMTRPLQKIQSAARSIAGGKLDTRLDVPAKGGDEIAQTARDFNHMARRIEQQVSSQKRLLRDVSHELRSPLNRLQVALELAQRKQPPIDSKTYQRIKQECTRLEDLISSLLTLPKESLNITEHIDLAVLMQTLLDDCRFEFADKQLQFNFQSESGEYLVMADTPQLRRALENPLRNAAFYTAKYDSINVKLSREATTLKVEICDQGPGVPAEELEAIFEPFYRVSTARDTHSGGTGVGLALCKHVVRLHGGDVTAQAAEPNGLRIVIKLPAA